MIASASDRAPAGGVVEVLLSRHGRTFAAEAGIRLARNTPSPLFRLLCLSLLTSARISAELAMRAVRALADAGWTTADALARSTSEQRTRVLNESGYARYDESTARYLGATTDLLIDRYHGDLRELRERAHRRPDEEHRLLTEFTGIGDVGAGVFLREVQVVWDELDPYADTRALRTGAALGLPSSAGALRALVGDTSTFARLVAALVRCGLAGDEQAVIDEATRAR